jgi:hypothetical protein
MDEDIELFEFIRRPMPLDVTVIKDPGMKSLVHLAVSLGWNVHQKRGQPVVITARDGTQKRLPTNTSIRMSVFQSALSTIMVHTEPEKIPTIELIEDIISQHKPSVEHQRRLRLAVGESPTQHRERVAAIEAEAKGPREPQPLTTRLEITGDVEGLIDEVLDEHFRQVLEEEDAAPAAQEGEMTYIAADKAQHGRVVSRLPYRAVRNHSGQVRTTYESDTSFERRWSEDDYVDYECQECGSAFSTPKGVGSHSQNHLQHPKPAWRRQSATIVKEYVEPETEAALEWEEPPADEPPLQEGMRVFEPVPPDAGAGTILQGVIALVAPELIAEIRALKEENQQLREQLAEVEGEFDAFVELAANRRKKT